METEAVDRGIETYVARCRKRIPAFVENNFSLKQTWRLQRPSLGLDLVCAPFNAAWALPHLALQKVGETAEKLGYPQLARWTKSLPPGIKTGYQRQIEARIAKDLLEWDRQSSATALPQGFLKELDAIPTLRRRVESQRFDRTLVDLLHKFTSGRALVSDLVCTALTFGLSWFLMGSTSVSLKGLAHGVAAKTAHDRAASRFFLGKKAGSAFYNVFPPAVQESTVWTVLVLLVAALTVVGMACTILSDPLRKALGFHRNRLELLVDEVEKELILLSHKRLRQDA